LERIAADRRCDAAQRMPATANVTPRGVNGKSMHMPMLGLAA
jgi:hypothetical protein